MGGQCGFVGIDGQLISFCTYIGIRNSAAIYRDFHRNRGRIQLITSRRFYFDDFIISFGHRGNRESPCFVRFKHLCLCDVICKRSRGILRANSTQIFFAFFDYILRAGKVQLIIVFRNLSESETSVQLMMYINIGEAVIVYGYFISKAGSKTGRIIIYTSAIIIPKVKILIQTIVHS